jgi:RNA polymerase sigma factor (sigma-70 family)
MASTDIPPHGQECFEQLYREHSRLVRDYALRHGTSEVEADDVVADTFLAAWHQLESRTEAEIPWLLGIARMKLSRMRLADNPPEVPLASLYDEMDLALGFSSYTPLWSEQTYDPLDRAIRSEAQGQLVALLARLPHFDREVFLLRFWEGLALREIAHVVDRPRVSVERGLRRAMDDLARQNALLPILDPRVSKSPDASSIATPLIERGPLTCAGHPMKGDSSELAIVHSTIIQANRFLVERVARDHGLLYELKPVEFEELVADLLTRMGYSVDSTPASHDGGIDLWVAEKKEIGNFKYVVQCKRHARHRSVGVQLVRELYGVVEAARVTAGLLVTTSTFTRDAKEFQRTTDYRIQLHDYLALVDWLNKYSTASGGC